MDAGDRRGLISVNKGLLRHPVVVGAGLAALVALLVLNGVAIMRGVQSPWLLGSVIVADLVVVGVAAREVLVAGSRVEATQAHLEAIVDSAMDAIITVDSAQKIVLFNRAAEQVFRCRREEAIGSGLDRFIPQRFRGAHRGHIEQFGKTGVTSRRMGDVTTLWALRADGEEFPIEASISQAGEADQRFFTVILRDITVRRQRDEDLRRQQQELRDLSARVLEAREEEKTLIARELHDELGQLLTALKMDLSWLRERVAADDDLAKKTAEMNAMLDQTVGATRRISGNLRPLMLDDLGLADAAAWLVDEFGKHSSIRCSYRESGDGALDSVSKPVATTLYRALQESLTNIGRHSAAKNAWVVLGVEGGMVTLDVEDDGRGISPEDIAKGRSLGLKGMRERVAYLGGAFEVGRAARGGTRVRVSVPPQGKA